MRDLIWPEGSLAECIFQMKGGHFHQLWKRQDNVL